MTIADATPRGTITFLFTDIEGSTRLWETRTAEMSRDLQSHDQILRTEIEKAGGYVFKTVGDAFYAAFATAPAAVTAALNLQRALSEATWEGVGLAVRAALHTGHVEERDHDYFGPILNRVARLLSAGHGGQVLLSQATFELVRDSLSEDIVVTPLGSHRLKDLQRPEAVTQLSVTGLRSSFPPLRTLDSFPNNLPAQVTSFVGREREMARIKELLGSTRCLTLTGSGGTGKTRLALQAAADLLQDLPDGAWLVELAPISDPALVPVAVAQALRLRESPPRPLLEVLLDYLRQKQLLLLLDNCEHLIGPSATLADSLLHGAAGVRILATSREPLAISGETTLRIPSLSLPEATGVAPTAESLSQYEAVKLFIDRALAADPGFTVTNANAPAVAQVCTRLDGVALAIELAAARVKMLSVDQIAARLDDRFRLLTGGSRTALPRQQTLRAAIDWSHDLLGDSERAVLRRLAAFAGSWSLEAAESVCEGEPVERADVFDLVARLADRSLVVVDEEEGEIRYRLLETVRQYAREKLVEAGEVEDTRQAHLGWFLGFAEEARPGFRSADSVAWHRRVAKEAENLRAALEWAAEEDSPDSIMRLVAALGNYWRWTGWLTEGERWAAEAVRRSEGADGTLRADVLTAAGGLAAERPDHARAAELYTEALELARQSGAWGLAVEALLNLGHEHHRMGASEQAWGELEEGLSLSRGLTAGDPESPWREVRLLTTLSTIAGNSGRSGEGEQFALQALDCARRHGLESATPGPLNELGEYARERGDWLAAAEYYEKALEIWQKEGLKSLSSVVLFNLAYIDRNLGEAQSAARRLRDGLQLQRAIGSTTTVWLSLCALAGVLALLGRPAEGARMLGAGQAHQEPPDFADSLEQNKDRTALVAALGDEAFEREYAAGAALSEDEARDLANRLLETILSEEQRT
jgi:predicted ATPase/class 3 adenylate cyclase